MDEKNNGTKNDRKTKAQLQGELNKTREELDETRELLKDQETKLGECQEQRQQAEAEIESLKEKLAEYESAKVQLEQAQEDIIEQPEEAVSEDISASKATFRIDLYPRQGHYQGKIEHLLTKQKKAFSGLDQDVIMDFISSHLHRVEEQVEEPEPTVVPSAEQAPPSEAMSRLAINVPNKIVCHNQPFQVQLTLNLSDIAERDIPLNYKAIIYAKHLGGTSEIVSEFDDTVTSAEVVSIDMTAKIPQAGTYRLEAALTSSLPEGKPAPYTAFVEGGLLQVY